MQSPVNQLGGFARYMVTVCTSLRRMALCITQLFSVRLYHCVELNSRLICYKLQISDPLSSNS